jgi:tetratricopeptide (TPR) repeat protein
LGIPLRGGRGKRRSYADYKAPARVAGPRTDPFRVVFYLIIIAGAVWVYLNRETVRTMLSAEMSRVAPEAAAPLGPTPTVTADPASYAGLADQAKRAGKLDEAIKYYREAGKVSPITLEFPLQEARLLLFRTALEYGETRDATLSQAVDAANRAILADLDSPAGYAILGKIKDWQGDTTGALNEIQRALEIDKDYPVGQSYLAEALVDLQRWDQAQVAIERAFQLNPNDVDIRRDYGYVLESLGDYASAVLQYEAAIQIEPNLPHLRLALGRAYRVTSRYDEALDQFYQVSALYPNNALVVFEQGRTYETYVGDIAQATEAYENAAQLDPDYAPPWVRLGTLYYFGGDALRAIEAFEKALDLGVKDNVDVIYQLGLSYVDQGDCPKAIPLLQQARVMAADDERILDLIAAGFETCSEPTPTPGPSLTPTP